MTSALSYAASDGWLAFEAPAKSICISEFIQKKMNVDTTASIR